MIEPVIKDYWGLITKGAIYKVANYILKPNLSSLSAIFIAVLYLKMVFTQVDLSRHWIYSTFFVDIYIKRNWVIIHF